MSPNGEIKIDQIAFPRENDLTSAEMSCLRVLMLRLMREDAERVEWSDKKWSAEAMDFVRSLSWASPYELSDVSLPPTFYPTTDGKQHIFISHSSNSATTIGIVSYLTSNYMSLHNDFHSTCSRTCQRIHM